MESSINIMLEGFAVRRYPDWEKVGYQKFDVGYFSHGELNGYGKKYILEPIFENNKIVGGYERITLGYFVDDKLNGIGIKVEDGEILEYGFYQDDRLVDMDHLMHLSPSILMEDFYFDNTFIDDASFYGESLNSRRGTGRGVVIDVKNRTIISNFVDNQMVPGLYIYIFKDKVSFGFTAFDEKSQHIADVLLDNSYRPPVEKQVPPKEDFGWVGRDNEAKEGFFDANGLMQGLGFKYGGRESGIYQDDKLIFGSVDFDTDSSDLDEILKNKHMVIPDKLKVKKMKYKNGIYIGQVEEDVPHGFGQYFFKTENYQELMDVYKQREIRKILIGNTKDIPEDIKYGDACYIGTFRNGKMEGYCARWIYTSNKYTVNYFWAYDIGILAYKDRFKPDMSLYEYYTLRNSKLLKPRVIDESPFDLNNRAYSAYFLKQRLRIDESENLLYRFDNVFYCVKEITQTEYELWIFLSEKENEKYKDYNTIYTKNLLMKGYKRSGEKSFFQKDGLFEVTIVDEGRNVRAKIRRNFR